METKTICDKIEAIRHNFGKKLLILGHHYQREEVLKQCDLIGDSFQLSAAAETECETILFCGVHFMAETADILANSPEKIDKRDGKRVRVLLSDPNAGCSMANMASRESVEKCWSKLAQIVDVSRIIPVTYVNSSADLKAFCGEHGGIACTSTNAKAVLDWSLQRGERVLFVPDQHLGRNTALKMGIHESQILLWNEEKFDCGETESENFVDAIEKSRIILWNGFCCVHQRFLTGHIDELRRIYPDIKIIVHPECCREVVACADLSGSTSLILNEIKSSPPGSKWGVGTESRFVERLAHESPDKTIVPLGFQPSYCETMSLTDLPKILNILENLESNIEMPSIRVSDAIAEPARICLNRMLNAK
ncbi:MAG: quinolinate synthase NadA [Thermoguttaceae bacterium]